MAETFEGQCAVAGKQATITSTLAGTLAVAGCLPFILIGTCSITDIRAVGIATGGIVLEIVAARMATRSFMLRTHVINKMLENEIDIRADNYKRSIPRTP